MLPGFVTFSVFSESLILDTKVPSGCWIAASLFKTPVKCLVEDLTLSEIAENLNVSRNAVFDQIKKTVSILEDYENTSNLDIEKLRYSLDNAVNYSLNRIKKIKDLAAYVPTNVGKPKKQSAQQSTNTNSQNNTVSEDDTFDSIVTENNNLNNSTDYTENNGNYIKPEISQIDIAAAKEGDYRPFNEVAKEKYGKNYDTIYKYLVDNDAFEYVNNGNLKPGDKIGFMIDESFESSVKNESWHKEPVIFMVHLKEDGSTQVVGVLGSNTKFTGLENLIWKNLSLF